jgi:group I intron endonuclease
MKSGIYKITSPSGKVYIGQSKDLKRRENEYRNNDIKVKSQTRLYNSFKKHGWENHQFEIIEYCLEDELNCSERFWQDKFDVTGKNGLNCILQNCGAEKRVFSEDMRKNMSERMSGENNPMYRVDRPPEWREFMSNIMKEKFRNKENHPNYGNKYNEERLEKMRLISSGKKASEETKQKMRESHKNKVINEEWRKNISNGKIGDKNPMFGKYGKLNKNSKIIIDTLTGELIYGVAELSKKTGINRSILKDQLNGYRTNHTTFMFLHITTNFEEYFQIGEEITLSEIFTEEELIFIDNSTLTEKKKKGMDFYKRFLKYGNHTFKNM